MGGNLHYLLATTIETVDREKAPRMQVLQKVGDGHAKPEGATLSGKVG